MRFSILSNEDILKLQMALAASKQSFTREHIEQVLKWADNIKVQSGILDLVLAGEIAIHIDGNREAYYSLTKKGMARAEEMKRNG